MAKLNVLGDAVQLKSALTTEEIATVKTFDPERLKLKDEEGNELFSISLGHASISKYGIVFCSTDAEGKAYVTTENSVTDHSNPELEKAFLVKEWAPILANLTKLEGQVALALEDIAAMEASVVDAIEIN